MRAKLLLGALSLVALLALGIAAWRPLYDLLAWASNEATTSVYLEASGGWGPVLLALIQLLQVMIAVLPGHVFMIVAGKLYGFGGGLVINLVSTVLASQVAFALARRAGQRVARYLVPASVLIRWTSVADRRGFVFFLLSFLFPFAPCDALNFVAGLGSIPSYQFLAASFLGRLPTVTLLTLMGSHGLEPGGWVWAALLGVAGLFLAWRCCIGAGVRPGLKRPLERFPEACER